MVTTVKNYGVCGDKMEFSGSSQDDMNYAKTFWQSVQLLPPMESRLVSQEIGQRLKVAKPAEKQINHTYPAREVESPELKQFLAKARAEDDHAKRRKLDRLANFRAHDKHLLAKQREIRKKKEAISAHIGVQQRPPPPSQPLDDPLILRELDCDPRESMIRDIDRFEHLQSLDLNTPSCQKWN